MQTPPNYQQYPPAYQPYPAPNRGGTSALAVIAMIISIIALVLSVVLNLDAFGNSGGVGASPEFTVENFSVQPDMTDYSYSSWVYYDGSGTVTSNDPSHDYLVVLKSTLLYGGSINSPYESYYLVEVINGEGQIYTYDSGYDTEVTKPNYDFTVIGYVPLSK